MKVPLALVYNKDRSIEVHLPVTQDLKDLMRPLFKRYVYAHIENDNLMIDELAPWQRW